MPNLKTNLDMRCYLLQKGNLFLAFIFDNHGVEFGYISSSSSFLMITWIYFEI